MNYEEAKLYLEDLSKKGSVLGLEAMEVLMDELGNPQESLMFIHIAGTNGKGSVVSFTESILRGAGYVTGQYTSPYLLSKREQIQVEGKWISPEDFTQCVQEIKGAITRLTSKNKPLPTVFEVETAMAFLYFKKRKCDIVILETGMGGATDATNIVKNTLVAAFTRIGLDHMGFLGETIQEIAQVKAGIIKPGCRVVSGPQECSVSEILEKVAKDDKVPITFVNPGDICLVQGDFRQQEFTYCTASNDSPGVFKINLGGLHQLENAGVAIEIIRALVQQGYSVSEQTLKKGLYSAEMFGRFTTLLREPIFIIDGAHNEDGVSSLVNNIKKYFPHEKIIFIIGVFKDKKYKSMAKMVAPLAETIYTVSLPNTQRTLSARDLKEVFKNLGPSRAPEDRARSESNSKGFSLGKPAVYAMESVAEAVSESIREAKEPNQKPKVIIAFGSLSYLSEVKRVVSSLGENVKSQ